MDDIEAQGRYYVEVLTSNPRMLTDKELADIAYIIDTLLEERKG